VGFLITITIISIIIIIACWVLMGIQRMMGRR